MVGTATTPSAAVASCTVGATDSATAVGGKSTQTTLNKDENDQIVNKSFVSNQVSQVQNVQVSTAPTVTTSIVSSPATVSGGGTIVENSEISGNTTGFDNYLIKGGSSKCNLYGSPDTIYPTMPVLAGTSPVHFSAWMDKALSYFQNHGVRDLVDRKSVV